MDRISVQRIELLHPKIKSIALEAYATAFSELRGDAFPRITQGLRTFEEQQEIYDQGRSKPGKIVSNAKPGSSFHNYGLALDFCLIVNDREISWNMVKDYDGDKISDWMEVVNIFQRFGFFWGGNFKSIKDYPHFEMTFGYGWRQLLEKHNRKDFIEGTRYVRI